MTHVVSAFPGQESASVCEAGDDFLSIDLQFLVLGIFFLKAELVSPVSQLLTWNLSLGFQAVALCLWACKEMLGWKRRCWPVLTSQSGRFTA